MAPATIISPRRRTEAPRRLPSPSSPPRKLRPISEILKRAKYAVVERAEYSDIFCEQCGSGERPEELLLCDKCDKGFHMKCLRPIVVRIPIGSWLCPKCSDTRKRRRRSVSLVLLKKRRRLLPFIPSEDPNQRLRQMGTLASALTAMQMKFSDELTYSSSMAPRSANQAKFEDGGMQVLSKEDMETLELCRAMSRRGECPPFIVVFDSCEGYTVETDAQIKDMTFIAEYTGDVDYIRNRENDDCDSMMTLLLATNPCESLVICPDKRGNIARFINGINNHTPGLDIQKRPLVFCWDFIPWGLLVGFHIPLWEGKKKQNCKCVRYGVNGECRVLLVATRDIAKGERLYYDYNGYEHEYPTHHFV
ncbi:putative Histone-lysine N-methyltransferase ATXR5 [Hibiscus syriacus]|uniref:Histone-lysine N-methyltransferase ATXR5 n=1 Tax=Hibiscus syriacus TaxID=106335 RepID=A0A6A3C3C1_HIBSY|nr:putative Histone-lysine N-methyltransferase ATXR5 [Hibiscus syriacus]